MTMVLDGTNGLTYPTWTTATRPASPATGQMGYNTTYGGTEIYNGSAWDTITGGPAFSAYANASQTVSSNVITKVALQVKEFDTASAFDNTTNYRFTPQVAGYYQVNAQLDLVGTVTTVQAIVSVYKNGAATSWGVNTNPSAALASDGNTNLSYSTLVYLNGSTDYIELYGYYFGGTCTFSTSGTSYYTSRFSGSLVRSA